MWNPSRSLVWRLSFFILGGAGLVLAAVMFFSNVAQSQLLIEQQNAQGDAITRAAVNRINELLCSVETLTRSTAIALESADPDLDNADRWVSELLDANPNVSGITIAFAQNRKDSPFTMLHAYRDNGVVLTDKPLNVSGEYMNDWYYLPRYLGKPVWVEPYYNQQSQATTVTYSMPFFAKDGTMRGIVACELSLQGIREMLDSLNLGESGTAMLLSAQGVYISHPVREYEMSQTMFGIAENLAGPGERMLPSLENLARTLLSGESGMLEYRRSSNDTPSYVFYRQVPLTKWSLSVTVPEEQVLAPLRKQIKTSIFIGLCGGFLLLIAAIWVAFSMTKPLHLLATAAGKLAIGDFDAPLPKTKRGDEIGRLTTSFAKMREDLHGYIEELTTTTVAKEKIASELLIAHQIQLGIVPKLFPPYPERKDLDLFATLEPAREVGGDLYDFSLLDEDHLYVAIGDVSGKGVPASLLMAVGKTLLKSSIHAVRDPARALSMVNDELSADNESCMFITAFCGILNLQSGHFTFANAGHNPPLILGRDGSAKFLRRKPGPALGAMQGVRYQNMDVALADEEMLLLYTDGVTEAMNTASEMFGEDRMREVACKACKENARHMLEAVVRTVHEHAAGAEQSDDITMLAVRSQATTNKSQIQIPSRNPDAIVSLANKKEKLEELVTWLEDSGEKLGIDMPVIMALNLAIEEWFINVVSYAFTDTEEHAILVRLWKDADRVFVQVEDDGQPFDPTAQATPDTNAALEQRQIGGLGIHFIRKTMSALSYSRENDHNIVTLVKTLASN